MEVRFTQGDRSWAWVRLPSPHAPRCQLSPPTLEPCRWTAGRVRAAGGSPTALHTTPLTVSGRGALLFSPGCSGGSCPHLEPEAF